MGPFLTIHVRLHICTVVLLCGWLCDALLPGVRLSLDSDVERFFFINDAATTEIYTYGHTLSLHDALPVYLTEAEFRLIKTDLSPESRRFLVKQGHDSV